MRKHNATTRAAFAVAQLDGGTPIRAYWANGTNAVYSRYMEELLQTDPAIRAIEDTETGEWLYWND